MIERLRPGTTYLQRLHPSQWIMLASFSVFCFVYPFAIVLLSLDLMPFGMEWMSSLLLAMLGLCVWSWLWANFGSPGLALGTLLFSLGIAVEYLGVQTGLPFGPYTYTGVLVPQLPGGVPLAIGFAWLLIVVGALFTARRVLQPLRLQSTLLATLLAVTVGALLAVGLDLLLEPVAYHVKRYWLWQASTDGYYGVPWSNFAAWFLIAFIMNLALTPMLHSSRDLRWAWLPFTLYSMNIVMFGLVNIAHGFWLSGLIAMLILSILLACTLVRKPRLPTQP